MNLQDLLINHEGLRLKPYRCSAGKLTIGVGHNLDANGITQAQAMSILADDIEVCWNDLQQNLPWFMDLDSVRRDALLDLCFNMGITTLLTFKNTLAAMAKKDWVNVVAGLRNSKWAKQVQPSRVEHICHMMLTGTYPDKL